MKYKGSNHRVHVLEHNLQHVQVLPVPLHIFMWELGLGGIICKKTKNKEIKAAATLDIAITMSINSPFLNQESHVIYQHPGH